MALRKISFLICLTISMLCLVYGYGIAGQWIGSAAAIITGITWLLARKYPAAWLSISCLSFSICLAVIGQLTGAFSVLMICSSAFALAAWDLLTLEIALMHSSYSEQTRSYENKHILSLSLALGCGLIIAFIGRLLKFELPFLAMLFLVALAMFGLENAWRTIKKRAINNPGG